MAYREVILASSPVGYYRLDEASGTTFADATGNGHTLTVSSGTGFNYSQTGLLFGDSNKGIKKADASNSFTGTVSTPPTTLTGGFSLEGWFKTPALPGGGYAMSGYFCNITATTNFYVGLYSSSSGQPLQIRTSFNSTDAYTAGVIQVNTIYHIAIIYDGSYLDVYINNILQQHRARSSSYSGAITVFNLLGNASTFQNTFLDEFAYYTRALTTDEIATHYAWGNGAIADPRGGYYQVNTPRFNPTANSIFSRGL